MNCMLLQESREMLNQLLVHEKEPTRKWLRDEMDRRVDTMLDSIFKRLTKKLVNADWDRDGNCIKLSQVNPLDHVETSQSHHSATFIAQPSTSLTSSFNSNFNQTHSNGYEPECDPEILAQVKREIKEEQNEMKLKNVMDNGQQNQQIEDEFDEYDDDMSYQVDSHIPQHAQSQQANTRFPSTDHHVFHSTDLTPVYDGQLANRGIIDDNNHQSNGQVNNQKDEEGDDDDEVTSHSVKRSRLYRPTINSSSRTKQTQIITHTLQCPQLGCGLTFANDKSLNKHLKARHSIDLFRCVVKECSQSFGHKRKLGKHIAQSHQHTTQWHCDKCIKHFRSYLLLSTHNANRHNLGYFQCSFPQCSFTGECRKKVYDHYAKLHKTQTVKKCVHPGCQYQSPKTFNLKTHQRTHSGAKPFRCKWPQCDFAATDQSSTIRHIGKHFKLNPRPNDGAQLAEPKDYLEVVHQLL